MKEEEIKEETKIEEEIKTVKEETKGLKAKTKGLKAKTISLWAKIIGGVIIVGGHILKWLSVLPNATSAEICACGFSVMGIFGTVDLNILADKFTSKE